MAETNKDWKDLWKQNYEGKGDCKDLDKQLKQLKKKNGEVIASYLPWAVVDRVFMFQDGQTEVLKNEEGNSIVEADQMHIRDETDSDGVVTQKFNKSYFVNVKAKWKGQEHTERYPLLSSTNMALVYWTQADLNRAVQRAKVKAIAIVSGIGYKLFEDGDLQFEVAEGETTNESVKQAKSEKAKEFKKATEKSKKSKAKKEEPKQSVMDIDDEEETSSDDKPTPKAKKKAVEVDEDDDEKGAEDTEETAEDTDVSEAPVEEEKATPKVDIPQKRDDIENEIKRQFLSGGNSKAQKIKKFLKDHETKKVQDLSEDDVRDLYVLVH